MTTPTARGAYRAYYEVLDRALDTTGGIRVKVADKGEAYQYRVRLHTARTLDRKLNRQSREPDDPAYGASDYDNLVVRVRFEDGEWWVYISPLTVPDNIEELSA